MLQAALGGAPTRRSQVRAYLRVTDSARGPLDFDSPGGVDTLWQRIFLCLRCGFHQEALEVKPTLVPALDACTVKTTTLLTCGGG